MKSRVFSILGNQLVPSQTSHITLFSLFEVGCARLQLALLGILLWNENCAILTQSCAFHYM
jgi:hypothetical protein